MSPMLGWAGLPPVGHACLMRVQHSHMEADSLPGDVMAHLAASDCAPSLTAAYSL